MDPLSQDQLSALTKSGPQAPTDALSDTQLKALTGAALSPDQSAALLGHATSQQEKNIGNIFAQSQQPQNSLQNIADIGIGAFKSLPQTILGAARVGENVANQTAGRVVNAIQGKGFNPLQGNQLGPSTINPQDPMNAQMDKAFAPSNNAQGLGNFLGNVAQAAVPIGEASQGIKAGSLVDQALSPLKDFLDSWQTSRAIKAVSSTAKTMTKGEQTAATEEGRLVPTMTGAGKFTPSTTEQNAGQLLSGKVGSNPIKNVPVIQDEIATKGREAEQFLGQNGRPVTPDEADQAFQNAKEKASRYLAPEQQKNYDHTIEQFKAELKDVAGTDPIAQNTGTYYKALKNFEQNVTARLRQGNEALLTDSGSAQLQAAKDVRNTVRDIIGEKHPEFKQQMYDLASLYDAKDNVIAKAVAHDTFQKAHPHIANVGRYVGRGVGLGIGGEGLYQGAKKLGL